MIQLRNRVTITVVLFSLLIIFVSYFFKNVQTESNPFKIPNQPLSSSSQLNLLLDNRHLTFKNSVGFPLKLAQAWVLQITDFEESLAANALVETLRKKGFKSYARQVLSPTGPMYRVFVGPEIETERIKMLKMQLDKTMRLKSLVIAFDPLLL